MHSKHWDPHIDTASPLNLTVLAQFSAQPSLFDPPPQGEVVINCPWHGQKINHPLMLLLQQIVRDSARPLLFRFFLGSGLSSRNRFLVLQHELERQLSPARVQTVCRTWMGPPLAPD